MEIKKGTKVKYIGKTNGAYTNGEIYEVVGYDKELDAYGVMSELDEAYCVSKDSLQIVE